jgi:hypothetical protein
MDCKILLFEEIFHPLLVCALQFFLFLFSALQRIFLSLTHSLSLLLGIMNYFNSFPLLFHYAAKKERKIERKSGCIYFNVNVNAFEAKFCKLAIKSTIKEFFFHLFLSTGRKLSLTLNGFNCF